MLWALIAKFYPSDRMWGCACIEHKGDMRRRGEESGFSQAKAEERDVVSAITTVLQELCAPGEWMPMARLNNEVSVLVC